MRSSRKMAMRAMVQEPHELGHVVNINFVLAEQRVLEGNVDAAVGIFDVEDHGVASDFAPVAYDAESVVAGGHHAGEVDGADFKILGDANRLLGDGRGEDSRDDDRLVGLENVAGVGFMIRGADGVGELGRC
jgi:hypothetical protein